MYAISAASAPMAHFHRQIQRKTQIYRRKEEHVGELLFKAVKNEYASLSGE